MIHIFPTQKVNIDPHATRARLVVCITDPAGSLHVMSLKKYLRRNGSQQRPGKRRPARRAVRARPACGGSVTACGEKDGE